MMTSVLVSESSRQIAQRTVPCLNVSEAGLFSSDLFFRCLASEVPQSGVIEECLIITK